jgi:hypothetical protein
MRIFSHKALLPYTHTNKLKLINELTVRPVKRKVVSSSIIQTDLPKEKMNLVVLSL